MKPCWDDYFMEIAHSVSKRSPDKTKVGAVIVSDNRIISTGYNGFPSGINENIIDINNRKLVHELIIHAETNCLLYANSKFSNADLYITLSPCKDCIKLIASSNIKNIYYHTKYKNFIKSYSMCLFFNISLIQI